METKRKKQLLNDLWSLKSLRKNDPKPFSCLFIHSTVVDALVESNHFESKITAGVVKNQNGSSHTMESDPPPPSYLLMSEFH